MNYHGIQIDLVDDRQNLNRIIEQQRNEDEHAKHGYPDHVTNLSDVWHDVVDGRAAAFRRGILHIDINDYGLYTIDPKYIMQWVPHTTRTIDAEDLIKHLNAKCDVLFKQANQTRCDSFDSALPKEFRHSKLTVACHPLATEMRDFIANKLRTLDGSDMTARDLDWSISRSFSSSSLFWRVQGLQKTDQDPHGFWIYQSHLIEVVLRRVVGQQSFQSDAFASVDRPRGWVRR